MKTFDPSKFVQSLGSRDISMSRNGNSTIDIQNFYSVGSDGYFDPWVEQQLGDKDVYVIDDFFKDIDGVIEEVDKLSPALVGSQNNTKLYFDGRINYTENIRGTEFEYGEWVSKMIPYFYDGIPTKFNGAMNVNVFKKFSDYPDDVYFGPHGDNLDGFGPIPPTHVFALLVFLNEDYEEGEGLNFYETPRRKTWQTEFCPTDEIEVEHFVQGKKNRAVIYDGSYWHGASMPTKQFFNEYRKTLVSFFYAYDIEPQTYSKKLELG